MIITITLAVQLEETIRRVYLSDYNWRWGLFLMTSSVSRFTLPAAVVAASLAWRGLRLTRRRPEEYGGQNLSRYGLAVSLFVCVVGGGSILARVPAMLEERQLKHEAYTRAVMYKVNDAIAKYREQYGSYPERLIDLQEMDPTIRPYLDYWEHQLVYTPMSPEVASRGVPVPFQNYELVSRGPDSTLGTVDDIVMRDGMITTPNPPDQRVNKPSAPAKNKPHKTKK
jgi:hypothetical protein